MPLSHNTASCAGGPVLSNSATIAVTHHQVSQQHHWVPIFPTNIPTVVACHWAPQVNHTGACATHPYSCSNCMPLGLAASYSGCLPTHQHAHRSHAQRDFTVSWGPALLTSAPTAVVHHQTPQPITCGSYPAHQVTHSNCTNHGLTAAWPRACPAHHQAHSKCTRQGLTAC